MGLRPRPPGSPFGPFYWTRSVISDLVLDIRGPVWYYALVRLRCSLPGASPLRGVRSAEEPSDVSQAVLFLPCCRPSDPPFSRIISRRVPRNARAAAALSAGPPKPRAASTLPSAQRNKTSVILLRWIRPWVRGRLLAVDASPLRDGVFFSEQISWKSAKPAAHFLLYFLTICARI